MRSSFLLLISLIIDFRIVHAILNGSYEEVLDIAIANLSPNSFWESFQSYNSPSQFNEVWVTTNSSSETDFDESYPTGWKLGPSNNFEGFKDNVALISTKNGKISFIGRNLGKKFALNGSSKLVVQYEVKLKNALSCGGAFIKLYPDLSKNELSGLQNDATKKHPLSIVFGPDKCLPDFNGIRLGLERRNPKEDTTELKNLIINPDSKLNTLMQSHLYTLLLDSSNQSFEIRTDGKVTLAGNLLNENWFVPSFNSSKTVPDLNDSKPENWDDQPLIPNPKLKKPDDWDETQPYRIPDPNDKMPENWNEDIPKLIPAPTAKQPEWWDESVDGRWVAPLIRNPSCFTNDGCGKWSPKMIVNDKYKGPWKPDLIANENYMGEWKPREIPNPNLFEDLTPAIYPEGIGAIVFEFLSGSQNMMIDNIYIGESIEEAEKLGNITFVPLRKLEDEAIKDGNKHIKIIQPINPNVVGSNGLIYDNFFDQLFDYVFEHLENCKFQDILRMFVTVTVIYFIYHRFV